MAFISRKDKDELTVDWLGLQIFFDDMYQVAESEEEIEFITDSLKSIIKKADKEQVDFLGE